MLNLESPFDGDRHVDIIQSHLRLEGLTWRDHAPHGIREVVTKCLSVDPGGRFNTARELACSLLPRPLDAASAPFLTPPG